MTDDEWEAERRELAAAFARLRSLSTAPPSVPPPSRHPEHFPYLTWLGSLIDDEERLPDDPLWRDPMLTDTTTKETDE